MVDNAYRLAFTDWLACVCAGARERAALAVRAAGDGLVADVTFAATAGHVLDFDDTLSDAVAHVSATTAPAALVLAARLELSSARCWTPTPKGSRRWVPWPPPATRRSMRPVGIRRPFVARSVPPPSPRDCSA